MKSRRKKTQRKLKNKKTIKKQFCAPSSESNHSMTCYSNKKLFRMRNYWNVRHPDNKIMSKDPHTIWKHLKNNMSHVCNTEQCWLKQKFIQQSGDNDLLNYTFTPESPSTWNKNPNEWLTSTDIENVMRQYERAYPCFQFLGPSPIDFDKKKRSNECVWNELCYFDINHFYIKDAIK